MLEKAGGICQVSGFLNSHTIFISGRLRFEHGPKSASQQLMWLRGLLGFWPYVLKLKLEGGAL